VVVESVEPLSPHGKAMLGAGERLLLESVQTGRDFCKSMVGVAFAAIPSYVGLLKLFLPDGLSPVKAAGYSWLLPVVLFLLSAAVFIGGHLPGRAAFSLDLPAEVERVLRQATSRRFWCGILGFVLLSSGIAASLAVLAKL